MLKGNILRDLIRPATQGVRSNGRKKSVRVPYSLVDMERNIREIVGVTRKDNPFGDKRRGNVILRKRMAVV